MGNNCQLCVITFGALLGHGVGGQEQEFKSCLIIFLKSGEKLAKKTMDLKAIMSTNSPDPEKPNRIQNESQLTSPCLQ